MILSSKTKKFSSPTVVKLPCELHASLGATSLSVCAPEDVSSPHVEFADEHVVLEKGETAIAPYLDIERLTKVAVENGVDFVHPGMICYIFLITLSCI
jgi:biotin carboxylase